MVRFSPILLLLVLGCSSAPPADPWAGTESPRVVATFAPLHCFAINVTGDSKNVRGLLSTQGPHHADPPSSQAGMLAKSDALFAVGLGIDSMLIDKMRGSLAPGKPKVYRLGESLPTTMLLEGDACACCKAEGHDHGPGPHYDGHVWLGIEQAKAMVTEMAARLDRDDYKANAAAYCVRLDALKAAGDAMLKGKTERSVLPFHGSMTYFAKTFDLKLMDPIQDVAGQEPGKKRLDEIVTKCLKEKVRIIAVEPQYGAETSAKALLAELKSRGLAGAEIIVLDPLETATESEFNAEWYETKMRKNLEALAKVLR